MQKLLLLHDRRPCRRSAVGRRAGAKGVALTGKVTSAQEADDGRRAGQRQDATARPSPPRWSPTTRAIYSFPADSPGAGPLHDHDPRRRLQARRPEGSRRHGRAAATADLKLAKTNDTRQPALQRRMAHQRAGHGQGQGDADQLRRLPHLAAHLQSTHDADEFLQVFKRMGTYSPGSTPTHPQPLLPGGHNSRPLADAGARCSRKSPSISRAST